MAGRADAAPNGYTQIPIAKVFGDGVAAFSFDTQSLGGYSTVETTQYGIFNHTEVGIDYESAPSSGRTTLGNFKYLLAHKPGKLPDIACGMTNIATGQRAVPYAVATTQPGLIGVSLGATRPTAGGFVGMGGVAYNLKPTLQIVSDYIAGRSEYGTLGVIASVTPVISVNVAYAHPNAGGPSDGTHRAGFVFNAAYTFHLKGGGVSGQPRNPTATAGSAGNG